MITALPYFLTRLDGSSYATSFASWLSVIWAFMSFGSLAYATWTAEDVREFQPAPSLFGTYSMFVFAW